MLETHQLEVGRRAHLPRYPSSHVLSSVGLEHVVTTTASSFVASLLCLENIDCPVTHHLWLLQYFVPSFVITGCWRSDDAQLRDKHSEVSYSLHVLFVRHSHSVA